jgi:hypothetical protein
VTTEPKKAEEHDWVITNWEYDDTFFCCRRCKKKTNCRRGYPDKAGCTGDINVTTQEG